MRSTWDFSRAPLSLQDRVNLRRIQQHNDPAALAALIQARAMPPASAAEIDELATCSDDSWGGAWQAFGEALRTVRAMRRARVRRASYRPRFEGA
jgi:hypothetical protein